MSSSKKGPPPRPPAPKIGIGFSFNALKEEDTDDEDLTSVTGKFDKQVEKEKSERERERPDPKAETQKALKPIVPERTSLVHGRRQNSLERIKDGKEKVQEVISKKIEEITSPDILTVSKDEDGAVEVELKSTEDEDRKTKEGSPDSADTEADDGGQVEFQIEERIDNGEEIFLDSEGDANLAMVDEYYENEPYEDFTGVSNVDTTKVPQIRHRKRPFLKKPRPPVPPVPVSMSTLQKVPTIEGELLEQEKTGSATTEEDRQDHNSSSVQSRLSTPVRQLSAPVGKVPAKKLVSGALGIFLYMIIPLPSYVSGMIMGMLLCSGGWMFYLWVIQPRKPRTPIPDLPLDKLPPMPPPPPEMKDTKAEDGFYKGWMNEIGEYIPDTYSINQTHSVYVHLEGTNLRLRRPKNNIPKRAMWDESLPVAQFVHQRHFEMEGSRVLLLPPGLVRKRLWSKKYPICIALAKDGKKQNVSSVSPSKSLPHSGSSDSVLGFEIVSEQKCECGSLYLFARTAREKEEWFKRLDAASRGQPLKNHVLEMKNMMGKLTKHKRSSSSDSINKHKRQGSTDSTSSSTPSPTVEQEVFIGNGGAEMQRFAQYMGRLMPKENSCGSAHSSPAHGSTKEYKGPSRSITCDQQLTWLNALIGRAFWDFLKDKYWADVVQDKLQRKLSKIHVPYFIEELKITAIDLGTEVPVVRRANKPYIDELGFWVDLDCTYGGKFKMTIETKVNLMKLKKTLPEKKAESGNRVKSAVTNSDEEDSAESSTDEEEEATSTEEGSSQGGSAGKTFLKYINKIAASKYFQSATENRFIKRKMEEVSNMPILLTVEVQKLNGTLAVNIPPPPTDRLWYGFRGNPQLWLVAKPKVGEREVTVSHITEWIEKKLAAEFQHVFVMPNMDDLIIPILLPANTDDNSRSFPRSNSGSEV